MASELGYDGGLTIAVSVRNLDAAIAWYRDVLGFTLQYKMDDIGWAEMFTEVDRVMIGLGQSEDVKGGGMTAVFGVKDIDAARAILEGKDVRFDGPTRTIPDMVRLATFFDPDGNPYMLYQSLMG
ncbi:MAG: VOC family protein [Fimbriimonadaceae bacterium]